MSYNFYLWGRGDIIFYFLVWFFFVVFCLNLISYLFDISFNFIFIYYFNLLSIYNRFCFFYSLLVHFCFAMIVWNVQRFTIICIRFMLFIIFSFGICFYLYIFIFILLHYILLIMFLFCYIIIFRQPKKKIPEEGNVDSFERFSFSYFRVLLSHFHYFSFLVRFLSLLLLNWTHIISIVLINNL